MKLAEAMAKLEALGSEKTRAYNAKNGAGANQFGVIMGDIRAVAKEIKSDPALAKELWATGNLEARLLSILITKPKELSKDEVGEMVRAVDYAWLADWLNSCIVKAHPQKEEMRMEWMKSKHPAEARAGWSLTTERIEKSPEGLNFDALLDRIEEEMATADPLPQWTMNFALIAIGVNHPKYRKRALEIGEKLGVHRDYPCSKGCTSPFAPIAINELVSRQAQTASRRS
jgi:3-methyladenine DNA glycosylase AlkD